MRLLQYLLATMTFLSVQVALAARPNYTYVGVGYAYDHLDGGCEQDGPFFEGSLVINELSFLRLQHTDVRSGSWCGSTTTALAGGVRADIGGSSSVYGSVGLVRRDYGRNDEFGVGADIGLRSFVGSGLEAHGFIGYEDIDIVETTYFGLGVNYWLSQHFSLTAAAMTDDKDNEGLKLGLRLNF